MGRKPGTTASGPERQDQLPQNIRQVGDRVLGNTNIYIAQPVYRAIAKFAKAKTINESGGVLVGQVSESLGKLNIMITGFIEAKFNEATPTTLTFTHESWTYIHREMEKRHRGSKIVGWIHTHPNFGIFLSEYDQFIHRNFFKEAYQVAYVVDPIQQTEGFFCWSDGQVDRCPGFYIYDKVGRKISFADPRQGTEDAESGRGKSRLLTSLLLIVTIALIVQVFVLFVYVLSLKNQTGKLQEDYNQLAKVLTLRDSDNQQRIDKLEEEIAALRGGSKHE